MFPHTQPISFFLLSLSLSPLSLSHTHTHTTHTLYPFRLWLDGLQGVIIKWHHLMSFYKFSYSAFSPPFSLIHFALSFIPSAFVLAFNLNVVQIEIHLI